jgi:pSer/pThr/pTyr-binding forkhead associated (FHA) protein/uncharacterized membrane protein YhaH (DUF805 family)
MYQLVSTQGDNLAADLNLTRLSIGRDPSNDLVVTNEGISGFHASIFFDNGRTEIVDQGSTNGTFVNGSPVQGRQVLKPWDKVRFAGVEFEVIDPAARKPTSVQPVIAAVPVSEAAPVPAGPVLGALLPVSAGGTGERIEIRGKISVGRASDNALCLKTPTVSSRHAEIIPVEGGGIEVADLGSTNGTWVNGRRIDRLRLHSGDRVRFDEVEYRIEMPDPEPAKTQVNPAVAPPPETTQVSPSVRSASPHAPPSPPPPRATQPDAILPSDDSPSSPPPAAPNEKLLSADSCGPPATEPPNPPASQPSPIPQDPRSGPAAATQVGIAAPPKMPPPPRMSPPPSSSEVTLEKTAEAESGEGLKWLLFSFDGRIGRMKYFLTGLGLALSAYALIAVLQMVFFGRVSLDPNFRGYFPVALPINLLMLWPGIALGVKRFHDQNRSGHWMWLLFVPLISLVAAVMLLFVSGTRGVNRFGQQPQ